MFCRHSPRLLLAGILAIGSCLAPKVVEAEAARLNFELDVMPILTAAGCNPGACHGKARGQNGFQLSLLGFDPDFDYHAITQEGRGRRVFPARPRRACCCARPPAQMPHGGGKRLDADGPHYETLRRWIAAGMPRTPAERSDAGADHASSRPSSCWPPSAEQQLARHGPLLRRLERDVTQLATFQSNESGRRRGRRATAWSRPARCPARRRSWPASWRSSPSGTSPFRWPATCRPKLYAKLPRQNFIDGLVWDKLQQLGITPSRAGRRQHVPAARLPRRHRPAADAGRSAGVPGRHVAGQARRSWSTRCSSGRSTPTSGRTSGPTCCGRTRIASASRRRFNLDAWLRDAFRQNMPYDQFVRELVTAQGSTFRNGAAVLFRDRREPDEITTMVSQLFLGVRLECAKCHHHPFEVWSQDDFYSLAAYFARIGRKGAGHLAADLRRRGDRLRRPTAARCSIRSPARCCEPRPLFGKAGAIDAGRRSARGAGRLDDVGRQPVLRRR